MFKTLKKYRIPYLFISPFFILFIVFQLIPIIWTGYISFTEWNGLMTPTWVGLANYKLLVQDYMVSDAIFNTIIYWLAGIIGILLFALMIALCLNSERLRFKQFFKTATFLPYVCASVAMGLIFGMLFDENAGLINEILITIGGDRIPWLTSSTFSKIPVIMLFNWRITPWFTIIILSGLLNISKEYYEAATVDGANVFQQFFYITVPLLSNIMFFCMLTITVDTWKMFNESYILAGPGSSNTSLFQLIYQSAFKTFKLGYASALSVILILILLVISIVQFVVRRHQGEV
ncbi:sugar ABC transporter permease [uncultured Sphaerochaeta sp.]|uniref:carbohydrate ABC transporter permease n=1 Tax=uncultured Sphaerochaeta sp. TaxID=886478 RepID=UPI002A0A58E9|nr:sugar ABC transporter permease [uncultured Sphaerochaeta sp.]